MKATKKKFVHTIIKMAAEYLPYMEQLKDIVYDSIVTTVGATVVAFAVKKFLGEKLGIPISLEGACHRWRNTHHQLSKEKESSS